MGPALPTLEHWKAQPVVRAFTEGDHVILHCPQTWPGADDYAGIGILRLDPAGQFVEHWDVLQVIPASSVNGNGMG